LPWPGTSDRLETPRLHLRPLGDADEALYCRLYTDPAVMRHVAAPLTADAARRAFRKVGQLMHRPDPSMRLWVVSLRGEGDMGLVALMRDAATPSALEMGTLLTSEGQGRGLAAEAQAALLDWLFSMPGVGVVWTRNAPGNLAGEALKRKLGFVPTMSADGSPESRWEMTRESWHGRQGHPPA
jgi:RimJ/RimL family protein N-acetyltransferase